jgi:hypothetical protein
LLCFTVLSLFSAGFAWSWSYVILGSVFFAFGADLGQLILKRAAACRLSGEWNDDDYDVLCEGRLSRLRADARGRDGDGINAVLAAAG